MATLTIRDLEDGLDLGLRLRAARHNRSIEEEVRQILRQAVQADTAVPQQNQASRIRGRVAAVAGFELKITPREPARKPPDLSAVVRPRKRSRGAA